jgi:hypothetical protein
MSRGIRRSTSVSRRALVPFVATLSLSLLVVQPAWSEVRWRSGAVSAPRPMHPEQLREVVATLAARTEQSRVVIHI